MVLCVLYCIVGVLAMTSAFWTGTQFLNAISIFTPREGVVGDVEADVGLLGAFVRLDASVWALSDEQPGFP